VPSRKEYPTFKEWFDGRFWTEWVVSRKNKPSEVGSKKSIMKIHLEPAFGEMGSTRSTSPRSRASARS
jgi:hypothetical protein